MFKKRIVCLCMAVCLTAGFLFACSSDNTEEQTLTPLPDITTIAPPTPSPAPIKEPSGDTIQTRFNPPYGYTRTEAEAGSFGAFLRDLALKEDGGLVLFLDGTERDDAPAEAVIALSIAKTSKEQGPRALVRLRAEYLFASGQTELITYRFYSGFTFPFSKWCEGYRINYEQIQWEKTANPSNDYDTLLSYLNTLFIYLNIAALRRELRSVTDMQPGDIFINDESGAVMVVDMAKNPNTGDTVFLLAQSPAPTQEFYILKNTAKSSLSPWYSMADLYPLTLPGGGSFEQEDLGRFNEQVADID